MKFLFVIAASMVLGQQKCNKEAEGSTCFKGRLEIKGICSNYTISLLEGKIDPGKIEASWTDEQTKKTYNNVFALASPCGFPPNIAEGEIFYFTLDGGAQECIVCQAYYPKPSKALAIKVLENPCR